MKRIIIILLITTAFLSSYAQVNNLRKKFFPFVQDTIVLDSLPIIPSSVKVFSHGQAIVDFKLVWQKSLVIFPHPTDSLTIIYRVFYFRFSPDTSSHKAMIIPLYSPLEPIPNISPQPLTESKLQTQGRLSRGIFFGSSQQPSLTSDFNLSLKGKLDKNTEIQAVITDNMFNANGFSGTYNFQDFDRAIISVKFPHAMLSLGDIQVKNNTGYFTKLSRSMRGGDYQYHRDSTQWHIGAGTQKGIFQRMQFMGQEGNQGPYRLRGKNGQETIVIVSGSERVYIDGRLKKRGADNDYTIDYTRGQLTFTANCLITKDSRITVEFEYWSFDYQRYSLWAESEKNFHNSQMYYGYFLVKDNAASPVKPLDKEQLTILYNAGDSASRAVYFSADSVGNKQGKILYCKKDTTVNSRTYTIFRYCTGNQGVWQVHFSYVGTGHGDYTLGRMQLNGRIYKWVGPGMGDYMPITHLPMPEKKSIAYAGGRWNLGTTSIDYELATSNHDLNLLSPFDDKDNRTYNLRLGMGKNFISQDRVVKDSLFVRYMLLHSSFAAFNPFLPVEFTRDWNIMFNKWTVAHNFILGNNFSNSNGLQDVALAQGFIFPHIYKGFRVNNTLIYDTLGWNINSWVSYNYSQQQNIKSSFLRTTQNLSHHLGKALIGLNLEAEQNLHHADTLMPGSYAFVDYNFFSYLGDSSKNYFSLSAGQRYDWIFSLPGLRPLEIATNITAQWQLKKGNFTSSTTIHLRSLRDTSSHKKTILMRSTALWQLPQIGNISLLEEIGSGTQPITEFYFVRVPTGQGQYAWIDFNKDGREQINEFQLTEFPEQANYIRIVLPSLRYIPIVSSRNALSLTISPSFQRDTWLCKIFNHINNQLDASLYIKNKSGNLTQLDYNDTNIVFYQLMLNNTLVISITPNLSATYIANTNINKDLLLGGEKLTKTNLQKTGLRYSLAKAYILDWALWTRQQASQSQLFATENYILSSTGTDLSITRAGLKLQAQLSVNYSQLTEKQTSTHLQTAKINANISLLVQKNLRLATITSIIYNRLHGAANAQVTYIMLQGYHQGWNLNNMLTINYRINKTFTLQANYQLRLISGRAIHNFGFKITGWL